MASTLVILYLVFMFIGLYFFFFYILLMVRNKHQIFSYPQPRGNYLLSVLVPTHNEEVTISDTIKHIMESDYKGLKEVIIINDGSSDNTAQVVTNLMKSYEKLKLLNKKNSGKADSLNQGIKLAKGELIAVVDADSYPEKESIRKIAGYFNDPKMAAVTSCVFVRNTDCFLGRIQAMEYTLLAWGRKLLDFLGAIYVTNGPLSIYRKEALEKINGFDTKSLTEDIEVTWHLLDAGYKTAMCLDALVTTTVPVKFKKLWKQRERWGIGGIQTIFKYKRTFFKKGTFGVFIIPYVSFTIILNIAVFLYSAYIVLDNFVLSFLSTGYTLAVDAPIFTLKDINLHPSILLFFFITMFIVSISYTRYVLAVLVNRKGGIKNVKSVFMMLFYLIIFLALYPVIWFPVIYRIIKRDYKW